MPNGRAPSAHETVGPSRLAGVRTLEGIAAQTEGARVSLKTHKVLGVSKSTKGRAIGRAQRDLAWKIALAIRERGTKALPFIFPAGHRKKDEVARIVNEALQRAVRKIAS